MEYKRVYITQDDDGHWYVMPYALKDQFDEMLAASIDSDTDEEAFIALFSEYMTGGGLDDEEFYIQSN